MFVWVPGHALPTVPFRLLNVAVLPETDAVERNNEGKVTATTVPEENDLKRTVTLPALQTRAFAAFGALQFIPAMTERLVDVLGPPPDFDPPPAAAAAFASSIAFLV
jgi:hypothetical protein